MYIYKIILKMISFLKLFFPLLLQLQYEKSVDLIIFIFIYEVRMHTIYTLNT